MLHNSCQLVPFRAFLSHSPTGKTRHKKTNKEFLKQNSSTSALFKAAKRSALSVVFLLPK
jgi:hypothetical protein